MLLVCMSNWETNESRQTLCLLNVGVDTHVMTRSLAENIDISCKPIVSVMQFADYFRPEGHSESGMSGTWSQGSGELLLM